MGSQPIRNLTSRPKVTNISDGRYSVSGTANRGPIESGPALTMPGVDFARTYLVRLIGDTPATNLGLLTISREYEFLRTASVLLVIRTSVAWTIRPFIERWSTPTAGVRGANYVGSSITVPAGVSVVRMTVPALAGYGYYNAGVIGINAGDTLPSGATFEIAGAMFVEGDYTGSFQDGDSYGWKWNGTVGASTSVGYPESPLLVRNMALAPKGTDYYSFIYAGTRSLVTGISGPCGTNTAIRVSYTAGVTQPGTSFTIASESNYIPDGTTATVSCWVFRESGDTTLSMGCAAAQQSGAVGVIVPIGVWTRLSYTFTAVGNRRCAVRSGQTPTVDGSYLVTNIMVTLDSTLHEYSDGDTPNWRWEGTAGASQSVGYSYTLDRVLGSAPPFDATGDNGASAVDLTTPIPANGEFSVLSVLDVVSLGTAGGVDNIVLYGEVLNDTGNYTYYTLRSNWASNPGVNSNFQQRRTGATGAAQGTVTIGRHLVVAGRSATFEKSWTETNTAAAATGVFVTAPITRANMPTASARHTRIRNLIIPYEPESLETKAVRRWLANKYGIPIVG